MEKRRDEERVGGGKRLKSLNKIRENVGNEGRRVLEVILLVQDET